MSKNKAKKITAGGLSGQPPGGHTILLMPPARWHKDIADYRRSVTEAERIDFPSRVRLYDLYSGILLDTHLAAVMEKRKAAVLSRQMEFSREGKPDRHIGEMLESPWFRDFLSDLPDTRWWGFSLFQFYTDPTGWIACDLVPRKHVDPVGERILRRQTDIHGTPWSDYAGLLAVGRPRDTGELAKAVPWVLYKQGTLSDWAQFTEIFGMPIREYVYPGGDDEERRRILSDARLQGAAGVYIHPENAELKLLESGNKSGSSDLYRRLVDTCNAELSKLVLGNTLTTEAGERGTQALGTVQMKGEEMIAEGDRAFILNVLNYRMTDIFESFGLNVKGGKFAYTVPRNEPELLARIQIDRQLYAMGIPVAGDYWYETYGIPRPEGEAKPAVPPPAVPPGKEGGNEQKPPARKRGAAPGGALKRFF
jgi:phage gp29-like protein